MASVVFFRAANVGGHQTFQPAKLAGALEKFGVVSLGAAGTFVVREQISPTKLRGEILRRLPFKPELMICSAGEVLALAEKDWFADKPAAKDIGRFVSVLAEAPRVLPPLPLAQPAGKDWEVRLMGASGRFVLSIRRAGQSYSNSVVEKHFGLPATTRNWNTVESIFKLLNS